VVDRPRSADTAYEVDYAVVLREPGHDPRVVHDHHREGLFPEHTWLYLLEQVGFESPVAHGRADPDDDTSQTAFVARRPG